MKQAELEMDWLGLTEARGGLFLNARTLVKLGPTRLQTLVFLCGLLYMGLVHNKAQFVELTESPDSIDLLTNG